MSQKIFPVIYGKIKVMSKKMKNKNRLFIYNILSVLSLFLLFSIGVAAMIIM